jgi:hypothetical protein
VTNGLVCAKSVVLLGVNVYGFPDMMSALEFKRKAYKYAGLDAPRIQASRSGASVPKTVTVLDRPRKAPRHITNLDRTLSTIK